MKQNSIFATSVRVWIKQNIYMLIFMIISIVLLLLITNILSIDTSGSYDYYIKIIIMISGYIGIAFGTHKAFSDILDNKAYLSRKTKYLTLLYQIVLFIGYAFICYAYKLNYILYIGGYLTIFVQFLTSYYYTKYNNHKFPKSDMVNTKNKSKVKSNNNINDINNMNSKNNIIDIDILK